MYLKTKSSFVASLIVLCILTQGCSEDTSIRKYTVAKKKASASSSQVGKEQRMLGFIIPREQSAWYFKLVDDPDKVEKRVSDFTKIVESLSFAADGSPKWELGEGWKDELLMQITYAKLTHEADGVSATVTQLPAPTVNETSWQARVFEDVNRWRKQLSLSEQNDWQSMQPELQEVPELSEGPVRAYYVSLVGKKSGGGMNAPFMNQMSRPAPPANTPESAAEGEPAVSATPPADTPSLTYTTPDGWTEDKSAAGPIRKAVFKIDSDGEQATLTVSTASVAAEMLLGMWFDQLGLESTEEAQQKVLGATESIDVNGVEATLYRIDGNEGNGSEGEANKGESILVARIPWNDREALFAKLTGKKAVVESQKAAFTEFLKSMNW